VAPPTPCTVAPSRPLGTTAFFAVALVFTLGLQLPAVLALNGMLDGGVERFVPLAALGGFGPLIAALVLARGEPGGVRGLLRPLGAWRVHPVWYLVAIFLPGALLSGGLALLSLVHGDVGPWFFPPANAQRVAAMFVVPLVEEIGWRGYALPRLQATRGPIVATLILGVMWSIWHAEMLLLQAVPVHLFPEMLVYFVAGSFTFTWIYNRTGGSLLLLVLAHVGAHLDSSHASLPGDATPFHVATVGWVIVAIALLVFDRAAWSRR
jgi:uncharacterized protein